VSLPRSPRICYAGTYERAYSRNQLIIRALRDAGARVEEAHVAVFERKREKSALGGLALAGLAARLACAYARLVPEVALRLLRCDALAVGYIGQLDMLALAPVARLMRRRVLFNPLVTLTDTLVEDRQRAQQGSLIARLIALVDRAALRLADVVVVDTAPNARYVTERFGVPRERVVVVAVGAEDAFVPAACCAGASPFSPVDVLFVGKFIPLHGVDTIIRAAALLRDRGVAARIELVGRGQTYRAARELAATLRLDADTLVWTDWIPFGQLAARLQRADVALGIFDAGEKAARVAPNKLYQALACGVASITRASPAVQSWLRDGESIVLVPPADPAALADAIARLTDVELRARIAGGGRVAYLAHASRTALADQIRPAVHALAASQ
jgi:glycosyltransferase involved in cell wall biosynthesis